MSLLVTAGKRNVLCKKNVLDNDPCGPTRISRQQIIVEMDYAPGGGSHE